MPLHCDGDDRVAQWVELRTQDCMTSVTRVRTPSGAQEKIVSLSESKQFVLMFVLGGFVIKKHVCADSQPPCVRDTNA